MSYQRKAYESSLKAHKKLIATKLLDGIEKLYENKASERRWIWELLQNAKDVADSSVQVEIILQKNSVEFKHNGNPFLMDNITYLIEQVSTKDRTTSTEEVSATTGKFGTGFMTTHLLSKKVAVTGILEDLEEETTIYKQFNLKLDRDATTPDEMIVKVDQSYQVFEELDDENLCPVLNNYKPNQYFDTSFKYELDPEGLSIAQVGINDLHNALSYTFVFIPKLQSVTVIDEVNNTRINYLRESELSLDCLKISTIKIQSNENLEFVNIAFISNAKNTICLAVPVQKLGEKWILEKISPETPMLFCDFPLIGSEKFTFPVILNSPIFNPSEPRDSVLLDERDDEKRNLNKQIFEESVELYKQLLNYVSSRWDNTYLLADSGIPENVDQNWYQPNIQKVIRQAILDTPIVDTPNQDRIALKDALIPYYRQKIKVIQFWELAIELYPEQLPIREQVLDWSDFIDGDWKKYLGINLRYELANLVQNISVLENLKQLGEKINKDESETLIWMNQVIEFVVEDNSTQLLENYPIIPNQYGNFKTFNELLKDDCIPEELKYVLRILGQDWKEQLAHLGINCEFSKKLDISQVSNKIDAVIKENTNQNIRKATYYLISCFPTEGILSKQAFELRHQIWRFAKDLDHSVPDKHSLNRCTLNLWEECDRWLLKTLVTDITRLVNVENLQHRLGKNAAQEAVTWLSDFIEFLNQDSEWKFFYIEQPILPNQLGIFKQQSKINFDQGIPEEIKDVLQKLGINYREKLLDKTVKGFNNYPHQLGVEDACDEINKVIRKNENQNLRSAVYDLISYFADENESDRKKIWMLARTLYGEAVPSEAKVLLNLKDFEWDDCNEWILKLMIEEVASKPSLNQLSKSIDLSWEDTIGYLDELVYFTCKFSPKLTYFVKENKVFPNQNQEFCEKKYLKKDGGIPSELKEIANYLTKKDWSSELLLNHDNFKQTLELFDQNETETSEKIAKEIDDALEQYLGDRKEYNFVHPVKLLFSWSATQTKDYLKKIFPYFFEHKAQFLLDIIEDEGINENIFEIIQTDPNKLNALAKLATNPNISEADLNQLVENYEDFRKLEELQQKATLPGSEKEVINLLKELGINMQSLKQALNSTDANQLQTYASCSRVQSRNYPNTINFDDVNEQPNIGELGEKFVYDKLVRKFGTDRVKWMNQDGEEKFPYDFKVLEENLLDVAYYIDAKSTRWAEYQSDTTPFAITNAQWEFMKECDNYYIARVFRAISDRPNLKLLNIKLDENLLKA